MRPSTGRGGVAAGALALLMAVSPPSNAHPDHVPIAAATATVAASEDSDPQADALQYHYQLMARLAYESPAPNQRAMFPLMRQIVHIQSGIQGAADPAALLPQLQAFEKRLERDYPTIAAVWSPAGLQPDAAAPVDVTRGLPRHILVSLRNELSESLTVKTGPVPGVPESLAVAIPAGATRLIPAHLLVSEGQPDACEVVFVPAGENAVPRTLSVPVKASDPATLRGRLVDADAGAATPGRVYVKGSDGSYRYDRNAVENTTLSEKFINELLTLRYQFHRLPFFYSDGRFELTVPPGPTEVTFERGFEHRPATETLNLASGEVRELELRSGRFMDMRAQGWYSGDTHIHWVKNSWDINEDVDLLAMVQRAEDLRVANNLTLYQWRPEDQGGPFTKPDPFPMGPVPGHDGPDYFIEMAEEYRNDMFYGHLVFLNLQQLIRPIATGQGSGGPPGAFDWPLNRWAIGEARAQGGISIEAHNLGPFSRSDVPVNVVSGLADSLDQLDPEHYYRFLDIGARIPLSNGSDHPARVAGSARVYVQVDGEFTYEKWIDGIRHGRTFTTSGPLLFLSVDGAGIGREVRLSAGQTVKVHARALSRHPLGQVQLLQDGRVVKEVNSTEREATLEMDLTPSESGWMVARCSPTGGFSAIEGPDIAHTSAVYLNVDNRPVFRPEAARFWIENMRQHAANVAANARYENEVQRQEQLDYINAAVAHLEKRLAEAQVP